MASMSDVGRISELWTYPVKSFQGGRVGSLAVQTAGVDGDRRWALIDVASGRLLSAKRRKELLEATVADDGENIVLPTGEVVDLADLEAASAACSAWLGADVEMRAVGGDEPLTFEMTFDPPNDDAEMFEIPVPVGTFLDWAPIHLVHQATLDGCATARPDLDWSMRRFRPNVVLDGPLNAPFDEQGWVGCQLRLGADLVLNVQQPTVRCAMPLRAQPDGINREPEIFSALNDLNTASPNHLGLYLQVAEPGTVSVGDGVTLLS